MYDQDIRNVLAEAFASGIFNSLQKLWFSHQQDETHIIVPSTEDIDVWFVNKSDEFDEACRYVPISQNHFGTLASGTTANSGQGKIRISTSPNSFAKSKRRRYSRSCKSSIGTRLDELDHPT
jgi:hypothetical protein